MPTAVLHRPRPRQKPTTFGPGHNGIIVAPAEFDRADFEDGWRYELVNGVLVVSPIPGLPERDPNQRLGTLLENYQEFHPQGRALDCTTYEHEIAVGDNRRKADRVLWAGLGRLPRRGELPSVAIEFVSKRRRDRIRDYEIKRDEYLHAGIQQYWVIDRFKRTLTVFTLAKGQIKTKVLQAHQTFKPALLPGFELMLEDLFRRANRWEGEDEKN